jgi:ABC-type uncharacterized transport system substrate-binding protein
LSWKSTANATSIPLSPQFAEQQVDARVISSGVFFNRQLDRLIALAARHAIPTIFTGRDYPAAGGLMSYGADNADAYHQAGLYVGRILRGDKPADLPVLQLKSPVCLKMFLCDPVHNSQPCEAPLSGLVL